MPDRIAEISLPYAARPIRRIERVPLADLDVKELLAVLIGGAYATSDASQLLENLGGSLTTLYATPLAELARDYDGIGELTAKRILAALELGRRMLLYHTREQINSNHQAAAYFMAAGLGTLEQEELWVLNLDTKNRVKRLSKVYKGNVNSSIIRPAEVLRDAVRLNAGAIIMAHNHPSADVTPSPEDVQVTRSIVEAGRYFHIDVLDHLIVGPYDLYVSLKERGLGFESQ
ncbi:MAG: DNA repair protein RadC [Anaerolineales bacterium]|nr:DNA repair protein RadC [Anaerolineales bacterium]